jgi:microcystin-dependent protein
MARNYSSISEPKTLSADITNVATQMTLNNVTDLPSPPYVLVISPDTASEEVVLVTTDQTGVTAPTVKISRAIETGATAKSHTNGVEVRHMIVGTDLQIAHDHIDNTTTAHNLNLKAPLASPTFTGNVVLPSTTSIGNVSATELGYVDGVTSAIQTQLNTIVNTTIPNATPTGTVVMWVTGVAPTGWILCQGQEVVVADYSSLASVLGTTYGALTNGSGGVGTTHFRLPDLRGRVPMGSGTGRNVADSANLTARTLGTKVSDAETHTLIIAEMPSHDHSSLQFGPGAGGAGLRADAIVTTDTRTGPTGGGQAHNNTQPSTVINFIIKS